ncbi:MAG: 50S ribosomal protein L21 [Candidatus Omnitrophica bacterium]|nr:50S ribosomal protein L21 [Candidatus Omnitrophota bacterium]
MTTTRTGYAIIATGGKQYWVTPGAVFSVEKLEGEAGSELTLTDVLAVHDGKRLALGRPQVAGAKVVCQIVKQGRDRKVVSFKYKRREGFHWKKGHRQSITTLKVLDLVPPPVSSPKAMSAGGGMVADGQ